MDLKKKIILSKALTLQWGQKNLKMLPDFLTLLLDLYATRNAEFTLPNASHKFSSVTQSVTHGNVPLNLPFRCFDDYTNIAKSQKHRRTSIADRKVFARVYKITHGI